MAFGLQGMYQNALLFRLYAAKNGIDIGGFFQFLRRKDGNIDIAIGILQADLTGQAGHGQRMITGNQFHGNALGSKELQGIFGFRAQRIT